MTDKTTHTAAPFVNDVAGQNAAPAGRSPAAAPAAPAPFVADGAEDFSAPSPAKAAPAKAAAASNPAGAGTPSAAASSASAAAASNPAGAGTTASAAVSAKAASSSQPASAGQGVSSAKAPAGRIEKPTLEQLEKELKKERHRSNFGRIMRNTLFSLVVVAAVSVLIAVLLLPVLQLHGTSMSPTFEDKDIVAAVTMTSGCKTGDLIAFYYNNNILVKRVIAGPGDWISIDDEGTVSVNGVVLDEPYLSVKALGHCDITFPYQVPDARYFVMGDQRDTSIDSRNSLVGCISRDMIIGRIVVRIWPFERICFF